MTKAALIMEKIALDPKTVFQSLITASENSRLAAREARQASKGISSISTRRLLQKFEEEADRGRRINDLLFEIPYYRPYLKDYPVDVVSNNLNHANKSYIKALKNLNHYFNESR